MSLLDCVKASGFLYYYGQCDKGVFFNLQPYDSADCGHGDTVEMAIADYFSKYYFA